MNEVSEILTALCLSSSDVYFCVVIYFIAIIGKKGDEINGKERACNVQWKRKRLQCSMAVSEVFLHHA